MSDSKAKLIAVERAIRPLAELKRNRVNGNAIVWPRVASVMARIDPDDATWRGDGASNAARKQRERLRNTKTAEQLDALASQVDPALYKTLVENLFPGQVIYEIAAEPEEDPPLTADERVQEHKLKIQAQHDRGVAQKLIDQRALTELLVDAVTEGVQHAPPVIWRPAPEILVKPEAAEEVPVALLGDIHVGTLVDAQEMGGLGEYNFEILKRRLNRYQERIARAIDLHRRDAIIKKMVVYMMGDMVEGEVIFDGQAFRIELITVDQLFEGAAYIMGWLQGLLATGLIEEIHVVCIYGNHGRTTHKKGASKAHSNWDYVMYRHMEEVLRHETRIKWFIPQAWFAIVDVLGWRIYGTHGDTVKSWMGIPFYGIQRHDARTTLLMQSVGVNYHYMVYGDKHITATLPRVTGAQIMNGSTVGGSDFSMHQLSTASEPMQTLFGINERHGKTWQYDCVLDRHDPELIRQHLAMTSV
jgi:hypothetical protein